MKYGIFLNLQNKDEITVDKLKKKFLKRIYGKHSYFDHKTHLTLFCFKSKNTIKEITSIFLDKIKDDHVKSITVKSKKIFYNDPLTKLDTLVLEINKTKKLIKLQNDIFDTFKENIIKDTEKKLNNQILSYNLKSYGYPFFGKIWIPHITLGSLKLNINQKNLSFFKTLSFSKTLSIKKISLNIIYKNGQFRKVI